MENPNRLNITTNLELGILEMLCGVASIPNADTNINKIDCIFLISKI